MTKHLTLLLFIGLAWEQNTTPFTPNNDKKKSFVRYKVELF